ncbi:SulP family inorganic anion transporter [Sphingomonas aerolata]|uniref:SulP family inorganic anion transporter n=1 Tax=Sphingomonas aerolata TaxID=185951 RepID=UPI002FE34829
MQTLIPKLSTWRADLPASIVVALVALPLCLGVALASGAPLFAGVIAGIVGGIAVGLFSKSPLSVSGPAAGLTVIVLAAIESMPSYQMFLMAVVLAGVLQIGFSLTRAGILSEFVPSSVITGMLAAIGLILILKQIPHAVGFDREAEGIFEFSTANGVNTFSRDHRQPERERDPRCDPDCRDQPGVPVLVGRRETEEWPAPVRPRPARRRPDRRARQRAAGRGQA